MPLAVRCAFLVSALAVSAFGQIPGYRIDTIAGSSAAGDTGKATSALLMQAQGMAFDSKQRLYIADANDHRVRRVEPDGTIDTVAGNGTPGYIGDGGLAINAELRNPYGIAIDAQDNLYIADLGNSRVRKVTPAGDIRTLAGGGIVAPGTANDGGMATSYVLGAPRNLAVDATGNLFVSDFAANFVYQISPAGVLTTAAGTGRAGYSGDFGAAQLATLNAPAGLSFLQDGSLLICDSGNKVVRRLLGDLIETYLPSPQLAPGLTFSAPTALAFNPTGFILVADAGLGAVLSIDNRTGTIQNLPYAGDIAVGPGNTVYFAQQGFVSFMNTLGQVTVVAGSNNTGFWGESISATAARLNQPTAVAQDIAGTLYIADRQSHRIRRIDANGVITTFAGSGTPGYSGDGGPATSAQLNQPSSISFDASGNLLVADTGNHVIRSISPGGQISTIAGTGAPGQANDGNQAIASPLNSPEFVLATASGIYIADTGNHSVRAVDLHGVISRLVGTDIASATGDGGLASSATLESPRGLVVDGQGDLYIADEGAGAVRRVSPAGIITTVTTGATGPWVSPSGLGLLNDGSLLISDYGTHEVRALHVDGSVSVLAGTGSAGFSGDTGPATSAQLDVPVGLFTSANGTIYIADTGNNRIRALTLRPSQINGTPRVRVVNAASGIPGAVAPGEMVSLLGNVTASPQPLNAPAGASSLPPFLGDTEVLVNGAPVPLLSAVQGKVTFQAPYGLAGTRSAVLQLFYRGSVVATQTLTVVAASPALYLAPDTRAQALSLLPDGSFDSKANPAAAGSSLRVYLTGEGLTSGGNQTGVANTQAWAPQLPVSATLDGMTAIVLTAGEALNSEGLLEVAIQIPTGLAPGAHRLRVAVGAYRTQSQVICWTK